MGWSCLGRIWNGQYLANFDFIWIVEDIAVCFEDLLVFHHIIVVVFRDFAQAFAFFHRVLGVKIRVFNLNIRYEVCWIAAAYC